MALGLFETPSRLLASVFSNGATVGTAQVAYGDAAGKLASASWLTATNSSTFSFVIGDGTTAQTAKAVINRPAGSIGAIDFQTAGSARWRVGASSAAESGSNAGSAFVIQAFDDS